jgi:hypothetical protein
MTAWTIPELQEQAFTFTISNTTLAKSILVVFDCADCSNAKFLYLAWFCVDWLVLFCNCAHSLSERYVCWNHQSWRGFLIDLMACFCFYSNYFLLRSLVFLTLFHLPDQCKVITTFKEWLQLLILSGNRSYMFSLQLWILKITTKLCDGYFG